MLVDPTKAFEALADDARLAVILWGLCRLLFGESLASNFVIGVGLDND